MLPKSMTQFYVILVITFSSFILCGLYLHFFKLQNGKTALHFAAYKGQLSSVKALAEAGADLDLTDEVHLRAHHPTVLSFC